MDSIFVVAGHCNSQVKGLKLAIRMPIITFGVTLKSQMQVSASYFVHWKRDSPAASSKLTCRHVLQAYVNSVSGITLILAVHIPALPLKLNDFLQCESVTGSANPTENQHPVNKTFQLPKLSAPPCTQTLTR